MKHRLGRTLLSFFLTVTAAVGLLAGIGTRVALAEDTAYSAYVPAESDNTEALANKAVKFNGTDWYIIKDESTSATAGTVTLLAKDPVGASVFHTSSNEYMDSEVKAYLDNLTAEKGTFADVADAIKSTDLGDASVTGAKLWLLSKTEAEGVPQNVLKCSTTNGNSWWLRTKVDAATTLAACVSCSEGTISTTGAAVNTSYGVRPALKLDLSKVVFNSDTKTFLLPSSVTTAPTGKTLDYEKGLDEKLVEAGVASGGTMQYALGEKDGTYSAAIPTATLPGTYTIWYKVVGDANHTDTEPQFVTTTISVSTQGAYKVIEGDSSTWKKGNAEGFPVTFTRTDNAEITYRLFVGVKVDGKEIDSDKYDEAPGTGSVVAEDSESTGETVIVTLKPAYLETLSTGDHTLTAIFEDGGSADAKFTVAEASTTTTCVVTFDANGGTGTMDKLTVTSGETTKLPENKFTRSGYTFSGWNTKADGSGTTIKDKANVKVTRDVTLYAQWKQASSGSNTNNSNNKNTKTSTASRSTASKTLAKTGDATSFVPVAVVAVVGAAAVLFGLRSKRR